MTASAAASAASNAVRSPARSASRATAVGPSATAASDSDPLPTSPSAASARTGCRSEQTSRRPPRAARGRGCSPPRPRRRIPGRPPHRCAGRRGRPRQRAIQKEAESGADSTAVCSAASTFSPLPLTSRTAARASAASARRPDRPAAGEMQRRRLQRGIVGGSRELLGQQRGGDGLSMLFDPAREQRGRRLQALRVERDRPPRSRSGWPQQPARRQTHAGAPGSRGIERGTGQHLQIEPITGGRRRRPRPGWSAEPAPPPGSPRRRARDADHRPTAWASARSAGNAARIWSRSAGSFALHSTICRPICPPIFRRICRAIFLGPPAPAIGRDGLPQPAEQLLGGDLGFRSGSILRAAPRWIAADAASRAPRRRSRAAWSRNAAPNRPPSARPAAANATAAPSGRPAAQGLLDDRQRTRRSGGDHVERPPQAARPDGEGAATPRRAHRKTRAPRPSPPTWPTAPTTQNLVEVADALRQAEARA